MFVIVTANCKNITKANPLHYLQVPAGAGLIVSSSSPIIHNRRGRIELLRSSRSRSLLIGDHSWTDPLRKTTTTPAKPASATATCAAVLRASPGSTRNLAFLLSDLLNASTSLRKEKIVRRRPGICSSERKRLIAFEPMRTDLNLLRKARAAAANDYAWRIVRSVGGHR